MLLFIPFRNESDVVAEGETAEGAFNRLIDANCNLSEHHGRLQTLLKAQTALKKINEARPEQEPLFDHLQRKMHSSKVKPCLLRKMCFTSMGASQELTLLMIAFQC